MKAFLLLVACGIFGLAGAQTAQPLFSVFKKPDSRAAKLALELTAPYLNEKEKVYAIFRWITDNVDYKVTSPLGASRTCRRRQPILEDDTATVLPPLDERVAELVLESREAVCDGYSRLFKVLCVYAGIEAEVVSGYARASGMSGRYFRANHSWNAVKIDSSWHLLDATWASGYTSMRGDQFIRNYDSRYYLTPPEVFIRDHYPEDPSWSLLPEPPLIREFYNTPFKHTAFVRNKIRSYSPSAGVIEASVGDTVMIELESYEPEKKLEVWDRPFGDPRRHTSPIWLNYPEKPPLIRGDKIRYPYVVHSPFVQWLYVVYNGESVLQYRLNVKQPMADPVPAGATSENIAQ